ncbi:hypothetical protein MF628_005011 [Paenibacillus polymyxa]|uniref:hypothetical protein n=1 Tax=Paenibacillus polymyxa TaxID=1406 RepID=UPI002024343D|nr:hypothetical protein [Paenibacillus polymyxa]URJ45221.1 hypothetical protein MF628_005011 [Paenibacillus polymyxa]
MKKKTGLLSLVVVGLLAFSQGSVSASSSEEMKVMDYTPLKIDNNLTVKKFSDGRIEPIENAKSLTEKQQYEILSEMGYTEKESEELSESEKVYLITEGGVKVNVTQSEMVHKYFDLSGKEHIITPENEAEINKIKEADLKKIKGDKISTSAMGSVNDGTFSGTSSIQYMGKTANGREYKYSYRTHFNWSNIPWITLSDRVAHAFQSHTSAVGSKAEFFYRTANGNWHDGEFSNIDQSQVSGTIGSVRLIPIKEQYGTLYTEVRIPVAHGGGTGSFANSYAHSYTEVPFALSLGSVSITGTGLGDFWTWRSNFTIGQWE